MGEEARFMPVAIPIAIAAGAVGSALINKSASSSAADAQTAAAQTASNTQLQMYNQTRADQTPWRTSGAQALGALDSWYGLPGMGPSATPAASGLTGGGASGNPWTALLNGRNPSAPIAGGTPTGQAPSAQSMMQQIQNQPGYQFQFEQGNQAVQRNLAARGLLDSGAAGKAMTQYGQGYASSASENYLNGLRSMAGLGQTAANSTGIAGMNAANQIGSNQIYAGNAAAGGYANQANAINTGLGGLTGAFQNYWQNQQYNPGMYSVGGQGNGGSGYNYDYNATPTIGGYVTPGG